MADLLVKEKPKRFLKIRNYFKLKKLEKVLKEHPVIFDKLDEENIEEVIKNPIYTDQKKDINGFDKDITADEVVNAVIDFYYSIS